MNITLLVYTEATCIQGGPLVYRETKASLYVNYSFGTLKLKHHLMLQKVLILFSLLWHFDLSRLIDVNDTRKSEAVPNGELRTIGSTCIGKHIIDIIL